jgi:hypothetical protein
MTVLAFVDGANDAITAVLAIAIAAILRTSWSIQQRISRLEAMDEYRERTRSLDRQPDDDDLEPDDDDEGRVGP